MPDYAFSVFSGISFLLCFPPAYFNWKIPSRPYATLFLIGWIMVINLLGFVDSLIWRSENLDTWWDGKIYCDIDSRLRDMFVIGIPASTICICRFLGDATDPNPSRNDLRHGRNRRNLIDVSICLLLPLMVAAANFTFQSSRYHIVGVQGCTGWIDFSWPSVLFYPMWCPLLSVIAAIYAGTSNIFSPLMTQPGSSDTGGSVVNGSTRAGLSACPARSPNPNFVVSSRPF